MALELVIFDMDGTIVRYDGHFQSSWDALGAATGVGERWKELLKVYINQPDLYGEWFAKNCRCLEGKPVKPALEKILPPPYTPGFKQFCKYLKTREIKTGIISSGVNLVADYIKKEVGLDFVVVNELHIEDGTFLGTGIEHVPLAGKYKVVKETLSTLGIPSTSVAYFGDSYFDVPVWREMGYPFGVNLISKDLAAEVWEHFSNFRAALTFFRNTFPPKLPSPPIN